MWYGFPRRWFFQYPCFQNRYPSVSSLVSPMGTNPYTLPSFFGSMSVSHSLGGAKRGVIWLCPNQRLERVSLQRVGDCRLAPRGHFCTSIFASDEVRANRWKRTQGGLEADFSRFSAPAAGANRMYKLWVNAHLGGRGCPT